jgi:hypothetical protein
MKKSYKEISVQSTNIGLQPQICCYSTLYHSTNHTIQLPWLGKLHIYWLGCCVGEEAYHYPIQNPKQNFSINQILPYHYSQSNRKV